MLLIKDQIQVRLMQDNIHDYRLMERWRTDERVLKFYGGRDYPYFLERVIETYQPRILGKESVIACIFSYQNLEIGYLQYYALNDLPEEDREKYGLAVTDYTYGIDLFIGEPSYWNQGLGSKVLSLVVDYIFTQLQAVKIVIDPDVKNIRAIRCYEKCGFVKIRLLPSYQVHEGKYQDCWLMAIDGNKSLHC
ncbi:GNAT family N-acetyltransferase [Cronbergia sp. UHCC 0137]|uniref:GNAT family N-acetyltransferase n=1 Tax=Cronbergia sp. UHCC 0137 TaxID=3110239 RepID=UPI002B1FE8C0|nr:GNAT family N-acetyltransferase [Cronbergia sp. UHCC 0137]MEA5621091.1 GNAT family N-acetyltransferase [Cronbergia sp. UHCC 0137]